MKKIISFSFISLILLFLTGCSSLKDSKIVDAVDNFNLFPVEKDIELGAQVAAEIKSNPQEYPILDSARNTKIYAYLYSIRDRILNSGKVQHKTDFIWQLRIIKNDSILNAFCTPGGYIYVYTGLMKYLDSEDELAGVLGHEMGHADLRHSTRQMTKLYGIQTVLDYLAGDRKLIKNLATNIIGLKFSRANEAEADDASVRFLCPTNYNAAGGAKFFEKIEKAGTSRAPEWLSTHPSPEHRIEHYHNVKTSLGCSGKNTYTSRYQEMIKLLEKRQVYGRGGVQVK